MGRLTAELDAELVRRWLRGEARAAVEMRGAMGAALERHDGICSLAPEVVEDSWMPANTLLIGDTVIYNVGGPSPEWVLELVRTERGKALLGRALAGQVRLVDAGG